MSFDAVVDAVFVMVLPSVFWFTVARIVSTARSPGVNCPIIQEPELSIYIPVAILETYVRPAGSRSIAVTSVDVAGPLLVTVIVY